MKFTDGKVAQLNEQIKTAVNGMTVASELPAGRGREPGLRVPEETIELEDGRQASIRFHKARGIYQLVILNPNGANEVIKEAASLTALTYDLLRDQAQDTLQRQDIEFENARIENGQPEGFRGYEEGSEETGRETEDWLQNYPHSGHVYAETIKYVSSANSQKMYAMVMGMLGQLRIPLTARNLDIAMRKLWDNNDEFAGYIEAARAEKQRLADEVTARAQAEADLAARVYPDDQPASPYAAPFVPMQSGATNRYGVDAPLTVRQQSYGTRKGI